MSHKSRSNWQVSICLKDCANRDIKCDTCYRWSNYKEKEVIISDNISDTDEG
jgi:hypothetical protein